MKANESVQARWDSVRLLRGGPGRAELRAGGETRQEGDCVVMGWGTREGARERLLGGGGG
jgi:hypothetical protein